RHSSRPARPSRGARRLPIRRRAHRRRARDRQSPRAAARLPAPRGPARKGWRMASQLGARLIRLDARLAALELPIDVRGPRAATARADALQPRPGVAPDWLRSRYSEFVRARRVRTRRRAFALWAVGRLQARARGRASPLRSTQSAPASPARASTPPYALARAAARRATSPGQGTACSPQRSPARGQTPPKRPWVPPPGKASAETPLSPAAARALALARVLSPTQCARLRSAVEVWGGASALAPSSSSLQLERMPVLRELGAQAFSAWADTCLRTALVRLRRARARAFLGAARRRQALVYRWTVGAGGSLRAWRALARGAQALVALGATAIGHRGRRGLRDGFGVLQERQRYVAFALRAARVWMGGAAAIALRTWRARARTAALLQHAARTWRTGAFGRWDAWAHRAARRARIADRARRAVSAWRNAAAAEAWRTWAPLGVEREWLCGLLRPALLAFRAVREARALRTWHEVAAEGAAIARALGKWRGLALGRAVRGWRAAARTWAAGAESVRRWRHGARAVALLSWVEAAAATARSASALADALALWRGGARLRALREWGGGAAERRRQLAAVELALRRLRSARVFGAFGALKAQAAAAARRGAATAATAARAWLRGTAPAVRAWASAARARALLARASGAWRGRRAAFALRGWQLGVRVLRLARLAARRMLGGLLGAFEQWRPAAGACAERAVTAAGALRHWRGGSRARALGRWRARTDGAALALKRRRRLALGDLLAECRQLVAQLGAAVAVGAPAAAGGGLLVGGGFSSGSSSESAENSTAHSVASLPWARLSAESAPSPPRWLSRVAEQLSPMPLFSGGAPFAGAPRSAQRQPRVSGSAPNSIAALRREAEALEAGAARGPALASRALLAGPGFSGFGGAPAAAPAAAASLRRLRADGDGHGVRR
ncbi:hypothetical protein T492DRAFT_1132366, partial [Pavlovales sp. CCMP2436]